MNEQQQREFLKERGLDIEDLYHSKEYILECIPKMIAEMKNYLESDDPPGPKVYANNVRLIGEMGELKKEVENFPNTSRKWHGIQCQFNNWHCIFYG